MVSSTIVYSQIQSNQTKDCCLHFQIDWSLTNNFYFLGKALPLTYSVPCALTNIHSLPTRYLGHFLLQETRKDQRNYKSKGLTTAQLSGENNAYLDPKREKQREEQLTNRAAINDFWDALEKRATIFSQEPQMKNVESFRAKWHGCVHRIVVSYFA